ncbi:conserved hypothetical protein [Rippkaea orientalis PCC 8801]|uniref:Uncharacterized protein n=1 Tax=Rippkaea orientalis (strain PCC 8801 / RF-1) TaxID=41431 RepID=B7JUX3_RIPO1|nr:DUF3086 domain-containing protein [Rippkaea orientalis]ACK66825.1 conserved hypothetical protein [Rippkaea orientalis PCC 8801]
MNADDSPTLKPELTTDLPEDLVNSPLSVAETSDISTDVAKAEEETNIIEVPVIPSSTVPSLDTQVQSLEQQKQTLIIEIEELKARKNQVISEQTQEIQQAISLMVKEGLKELEQQKQALEIAIEKLERRRERIKEEMRTTFAGVSQDLAIRVQGFKDYLVGSLQDLAAAAEQLELSTNTPIIPPPEPISPPLSSSSTIPLAPQQFEAQTRKIQRILEQYRNNPDYYGPPWQLRRTFEPIHAERVQDWFFSQGGRGSIRSMGTRLQNILIASSVISVLNELHGDRLRCLILANSPERLGEWRRGLQDCLGISRGDFGPERGIVLFESSDALVLKAERLLEDKLIPLVIIDETEEQIEVSLLQFPLWLAFARDPQQMSSYLY